MSSPRTWLKIYAALLRLYPRQYKKAYGGQMLQTVADMLDDAPTAAKRIAVWWRIATDFPLSVCKEHFQTIGDKMNTRSDYRRKLNIAGAAGLLVLSLSVLVFNRIKILQGPPFEGLPQPLMLIATIVLPLLALSTSSVALYSTAVKARNTKMILRQGWPFLIVACVSFVYLTIIFLDLYRVWRHGIFPM